MSACDMLALATPGVQSLSAYQPGKPLEALEREYGVRNAVKLASNENPLGPSPKALAAARAALNDIQRYPDGNGFALKQALARDLGVDMTQVTLGNGSNDLLELATRAFATAAHEIVFSAHAFAVYPIVTQAIGATAVVTPARAWGHDLQAMRAAITERTRLVFVANPNNPTGTWLAATELEAFVLGLPRHVIAVVDEAYFEYVQEPAYSSMLALIARCPNLIVMRTFSKAYGLAGLRVGYAISTPDVADILNRVRQPFNVNAVALAAAAAALSDPEHVSQAVARNRDGMLQVKQGLARLGWSHIPSAANFLCIDFKHPAAALYERLLRAGVIVRPLANYGMPNHLRVTIGLAQENDRFLTALERAMGDP